MPPSVIAVVNAYPRFDAVFDPVALEMRMFVKKYPGIRPMADDLNAKILPPEDLALIICTGTSEENDAAQYRQNMGLLGQLAKHSKLKSVPVLFLGYKGDNYLLDACEGCGAAYLDLPVRKGALIGKIRALCEVTPLQGGRGDGGSPTPALPLNKGEGAEGGRGMSAAESERRLATVMFADISGFTAMSEKMDPEEVTGIMNGVFREMETVIKGHGGTIDKFIGDCVMVLFGVPTAIENAPLRAVNTAIEMRNRLYQFNKDNNLAIPLDIHIGVNTGPVVAGHVGGADKKDYTVMGDAVNLASRIEGASEKGQILVGPDTYRATENDFEYRTLPPVILKGKAEPVPVYEVLSTKESAARRTRPGARVTSRRKKGAAAGPDRMIFSEMVGRDEEMNELRHAVTGLVRGKGGIVNVIGEAGIGKSRLMAELKSDPAMKQVTLLEGQALSMGRTLSFHPIIDLLKNWAGISEEDQEGAQLAKLDRAVRAVHPDEADEIVPFVATMMGMKLTGKFAERVKGIEGEGLEKLIFKNVRALLIRGSEIRPMIIRVEDLHWADTSSIELLISLFRLARDHRIMFLNFFRPNYEETGDRVARVCREEYSSDLTSASGATQPTGSRRASPAQDVQKRLASLKERGSAGENSSQGLPSPSGRGAEGEGGISSHIYTEILIQPLDGNESAVLISNLLNIRGLPQSLRDQITGRAGGNPFFIEEVVRSLIDEGAVVRKGDSFAVTEKIHDVKVPLTINEVLMSRIDRLDEETRSLIKTASVIGRYFFYKIIAQVAQNISDIDNRLAHLEDIQLIRERKRMDELEYLFKHALAQEAAYESILIQKRKELHLHVAQAIEGVFAGRLHEFYGMLAYHYSMGENLDKAEEYMIRAGEEAMKSSASSEALEYFKNALTIYREKQGDEINREKIFSIEYNMALSHFYRGHYSESAIIIKEILDYYIGRMPKSRLFQLAISVISLLHFIIALYFPSIKFKKIPSDRDKYIIEMYLYRLQSILLTDPDQYVIENPILLKMLSNFNLTSYQNASGILAGTSQIFSYGGISFRISKRILAAVKDAVGNTNAFSTIWFKTSTLLYHYYSGEWNNWEEFDDSILQLGLKSGTFHQSIVYTLWQFYFYLHKGYIDKAHVMIDVLYNIAESYNNDFSKACKYHGSTILFIKKRMLQEAVIEADKGIVFTNAISDRINCAALYSFKALAKILSGDFDEASNSLDNASDALADSMAPPVKSIYYQSEFMVFLKKLERSLETDTTHDFAILKKMAIKSGKKQLKYAVKASDFITEGFRMMGVFYWLCGRPKKAIRWWKKSMDAGERLGAKLELSRTYAEIGKRLGGRFLHLEADPNGGTPHHHARIPRALVRAHVYAEKRLGLSPEECLDKAETMFREMGLEWDLAELEKVRDSMVKNN